MMDGASPFVSPDKKADLCGFDSDRLRKGCAHLDVASYQVRWLLVRLQGDVDGGERPAGHLLHLPQQLLGRRRKKREECEGQ